MFLKFKEIWDSKWYSSKYSQEMHKFNSPALQKLFSEISRTGNFLDKLKLADITPVFKKNNSLEKENYRPVSVLLVVSKIFERLMQKQVTLFTEKLLSPYLCSYRKGFSTQQALISLIKRWRKKIWSKRVWRGNINGFI